MYKRIRFSNIGVCNRIVRMIQKGSHPKLAIDIESQYHDADLNSFNVIAEIPGTDLKDEVVMLGGHFDSWHAGRGGDTPRERPRATYELKAEHEKFSAYFNLDNGTGKIRGIYLQGNEAVRPIFRAWLSPFAEMGATTITSSNTGGTDHQSFDSVGLPGFQFIQDPLEYDTRTHHSSMDVYERIQADDAKQASIIMAAFVYQAAIRDEKLPRKALDGEVVTAPAAIIPL